MVIIPTEKRFDWNHAPVVLFSIVLINLSLERTSSLSTFFKLPISLLLVVKIPDISGVKHFMLICFTSTPIRRLEFFAFTVPPCSYINMAKIHL